MMKEKTPHILVIGGVAAGASFAARIVNLAVFAAFPLEGAVR